MKTQQSTDALPGDAKRTDGDIYRRSLVMLPVFAVLWAAIAWGSGFYSAATHIARITMLCFLAIAGAQCFFALIQAPLYRASANTWRFFFYALMFANTALWGAIFAACFFETSFLVAILPITLATAGLVGAGVSHCAPSRWVAQSYASVMLLPAVFMCLSNKEHVVMGVGILAYWFYCLLIVQRFHREYGSGFAQVSSVEQEHTELQRQNRTDGLTQVFNRRYFDQALVREWELGAADGSWLGLLFIDIDFFKKINDTYGHMAGDECLMQAAAIINGAVQSGNDIVARYGGEEFAVLLPRTSPDMAKRIAESIRKQFELKDFCFDERCIKITASIGVSSMVPRLTSPATLLIDQADQGVYLAKEAGRNNVQLFGAG